MKTKLLNQNRCHLIPFLMAGLPSLSESEELAAHMIREGADALEIGVPFSDALADGPVIQQAAEQALKHNISLDDVLGMIQRLRAKFPTTPLIVFSYLNPIYRMGYSNYFRKALASGVSATLVVDLPPEEAELFLEAHDPSKISTIFLASPTTAEPRLRLIDRISTGFVYYVSRA
ncbi:MAG: tryptophan synthase subunit alpha, partial [Bdellovibrionales bacterium]|nr:tryptophan synthase subunit alpha [Bdellovibrionales bacterium]